MQGEDRLRDAMHLQVSQVSAKAKEIIEAKGGSVTTVYYNALGLRALLRPEWFARKGAVPLSWLPDISWVNVPFNAQQSRCIATLECMSAAWRSWKRA